MECLLKMLVENIQKPYANPHMKNKTVTRETGMIDWRVVISAAPVTAWSSTLLLR
jgi:hypothetical protein